MKKLLSLILCIAISLFAVACGGGGDDGGSSEGGKVKIGIPAGWGGGAGTSYMEKLMEYFNESEEWGNQAIGKYTGSEVHLLQQDIPTNASQIPTSGGDIISFDHRVGNILQTKDYLVDITDIMVEENIPGEDKAIADKIPGDYKRAFADYSGERYYGAPGGLTLSSVSIDTEMWERENLFIAGAKLNNAEDYDEYAANATRSSLKQFKSEKFGITLWFSDYDGDGTGKYGFPSKAQNNGQNGYTCPRDELYLEDEDLICVGPDGQYGTIDDGLPSSVVEMLALCDYIRSPQFAAECQHDKYAPFGLSGQYAYSYANYFLEGLYGSLAGENFENVVQRFNSQGEKIRVVTGYTNENLYPGIDYIKKPIIKEVVVTPECGYYSSWMEDKFYAEAALEIIKTEGFFGYMERNDISHTGAQLNFLYGGYSDKDEQEACAFFIEGTYWSMEVNREDVNAYNKLYMADDNATNRRTEIISLPTEIHEPVQEGEGDINTFTGGLLGYTSINKQVESDPDKLAYCKLWLQFVNTEYVLAYKFWATHFVQMALADYDSVIANPQYANFFAQIGLQENYFNQYHFAQYRKLASNTYSRVVLGVGDLDGPINFRNQTGYYNRIYASGIFGVGGTTQAYDLIWKPNKDGKNTGGAVAAFEKQMYDKGTWQNLYGSAYNDVEDSKKSYNNITYTKA